MKTESEKIFTQLEKQMRKQICHEVLAKIRNLNRIDIYTCEVERILKEVEKGV